MMVTWFRWYICCRGKHASSKQLQARHGDFRALIHISCLCTNHCLQELKRLGAHVKYAMVASVSAYTKVIENSLQEKKDLEDEICNLRMKNYEVKWVVLVEEVCTS